MINLMRFQSEELFHFMSSSIYQQQHLCKPLWQCRRFSKPFNYKNGIGTLSPSFSNDSWNQCMSTLSILDEFKFWIKGTRSHTAPFDQKREREREEEREEREEREEER